MRTIFPYSQPLDVVLLVRSLPNMALEFAFHTTHYCWHKSLDHSLYLLGSKTLGTKCIRTSICNVSANHDQNLESRFRLLKVCLCVKLESSNCRTYWTKSARLDRLKIRLNRLNLVQIVFSKEFPT